MDRDQRSKRNVWAGFAASVGVFGILWAMRDYPDSQLGIIAGAILAVVGLVSSVGILTDRVRLP
jgi:hypothetical protein